MKKLFTLSYFVFLVSYSLFAQSVGIGTNAPNASAQLDVTATNKGMLVPRVTNAQMLAIASPANGLLVYNTDSACFAYRNATAWVFLKGNATASNDWSTKGNAGTDTSKNFIGTTDNVDLLFKRNNQRAGWINELKRNTSWGAGTLNPATTGSDNTANGYKALTANSAGGFNTASGAYALFSNNVGIANTATGYEALFFNTTGINNTASGATALLFNSEGSSNTASGYGALSSNTVGYSNVAMGINALNKNTDHSNLVAIGDSALFNNGIGGAEALAASANTAVGSKTLFANTIGHDNTAVGYNALYNNISGNYNTAMGYFALNQNINGYFNSAFGHGTLRNNKGENNTAMGMDALGQNATGYYNTAVGKSAGSNNNGSNNVFLGYAAGQNETGSNKLYISNYASDADNTLIYGEFDSKLLRSNGRMEINSDNTTNDGLRVIKNYAAGTNSNTKAIYGENIVDGDWGIGIEGKGGRTGVQGQSQGSGALTYAGVKGIADGNNTGVNTGLWGVASGSALSNRAVIGEATGTTGDKYGLYGYASGAGTNYGVYGTAVSGTTNYAGYFNGDVYASGNVGIGTATPQSKLEVAGKIKVTTTAGNTGLDLATSDAYAELRHIRNTTNAGDHNLYFGFNGDAASSINFYNGGLTPSVTMVNKNVGIGTSAPANKLSVVGNADFSGNVGIGTTAPTVKLDVSGYIRLTNSPSNSNGNVGIGTAPVNNSKLNINSNQIYGVFIDGSCPLLGAMLNVIGTSDQDIVRIGGTAAGYNLYVNGTAAKTDGLSFWSLASDARLKEQIAPYKGGLAELLKINPVKYHYTKASGFASDHENIGILAQELKEVAPYMVFKKKGNNTNEEYYNVNLSPMLFMYVNAFKELDAKNKDLEQKIAKLEAMVKALAEKK